jgi:hypothetical protein
MRLFEYTVISYHPSKPTLSCQWQIHLWLFDARILTMSGRSTKIRHHMSYGLPVYDDSLQCLPKRIACLFSSHNASTGTMPIECD